MKTQRRHELRQNELSQQIDQVGDYIRTHATMLTVVCIGVLVVVVGGFWYARQRQAAYMSGWAALNDTELAADATMAIEKYRKVADEARTEALAVEAWTKIGETAMAQLISGNKPSAGEDWSDLAAHAFEMIVRKYDGHPMAVAAAQLSLGVLAENTGKMEEARGHYEKILADSRVSQTPFPAQARFRLDHLEAWSKPVEFAAAPPPAIAAPAGGVTELLNTSQPASGAPESTTPVSAAPETTAPATSQPSASATDKIDPEIYYVNEHNPYPPYMFPSSAPAGQGGQPSGVPTPP